MTSEEEVKVHEEAQTKGMRLRYCGRASVFIIALFFYHVWFPLTLPPLPTTTDRVFFTLRWQLPGLAFFLSIIFTISHLRFSNPKEMNPLDVDACRVVAVHGRVLTNTLEQLAVQCPLQVILSMYLEEGQMKMIPILVFIFILGRVTFWYGYVRPCFGNLNRVFGMAMNLQACLATMAYCLYCFARECANV